MLTIPDAKGLFHKAISHSGGGRDGVLTGRPVNKENADPFYMVSAETIGVNFAKKHGIDENDTDALVKLRKLRVEDIVDGGLETDGQGGPRIYSGPILDGKLVVETAESAYKARRFAKVPLMIGSCNAEISGNFVNMSQTKDELFSLLGSLQNEARAAYDPEGTTEFADFMTKFNTDWVWGEPTRMTAKSFSNHGIPSYIYLFSYVHNSLKMVPDVLPDQQVKLKVKSISPTQIEMVCVEKKPTGLPPKPFVIDVDVSPRVRYKMPSPGAADAGGIGTMRMEGLSAFTRTETVSRPLTSDEPPVRAVALEDKPTSSQSSDTSRSSTKAAPPANVPEASVLRMLFGNRAAKGQ